MQIVRVVSVSAYVKILMSSVSLNDDPLVTEILSEPKFKYGVHGASVRGRGTRGTRLRMCPLIC